MDEVELA